MLLLHGTAGAANPTFFGYDLPRLHAALNDFPPALLLTAVFLEILYLWTRRDSLRAASYWTLVLGTLSTVVTVISGLLAARTIMDAGETRALMEEHEDAAYWTLGFFVVLAIWRVARERVMARRERIWALALLAGRRRDADPDGAAWWLAGLRPRGGAERGRDAGRHRRAGRHARGGKGGRGGLGSMHDHGGMVMDSTGSDQHADSAEGSGARPRSLGEAGAGSGERGRTNGFPTLRDRSLAFAVLAAGLTACPPGPPVRPTTPCRARPTSSWTCCRARRSRRWPTRCSPTACRFRRSKPATPGSNHPGLIRRRGGPTGGNRWESGVVRIRAWADPGRPDHSEVTVESRLPAAGRPLAAGAIHGAGRAARPPHRQTAGRDPQVPGDRIRRFAPCERPRRAAGTRGRAEGRGTNPSSVRSLRGGPTKQSQRVCNRRYTRPSFNGMPGWPAGLAFAAPGSRRPSEPEKTSRSTPSRRTASFPHVRSRQGHYPAPKEGRHEAITDRHSRPRHQEPQSIAVRPRHERQPGQHHAPGARRLVRAGRTRRQLRLLHRLRGSPRRSCPPTSTCSSSAPSPRRPSSPTP